MKMCNREKPALSVRFRTGKNSRKCRARDIAVGLTCTIYCKRTTHGLRRRPTQEPATAIKVSVRTLAASPRRSLSPLVRDRRSHRSGLFGSAAVAATATGHSAAEDFAGLRLHAHSLCSISAEAGTVAPGEAGAATSAGRAGGSIDGHMASEASSS